MTESRKAFEEAMLSRYTSMETLFMALAKKSGSGHYVREEVQSMWEGWQLCERSQARRSQGKRGDDRG